MLAMTWQDAAFLLVVLLVTAGGVGLVLWSRKKGERSRVHGEPEGPQEIAEPTEEKAPAKPIEAAKPVEELPRPGLLPIGTSIQEGLEKTRTQGFVSRLTRLFRKELDEELEAKIEEVLLTSDIGVSTAQKLLARIRQGLSTSELRDATAVWTLLRAEVRSVLMGASGEQPECAVRPKVIVVIGVNGTGKTTTIGKLAARYSAEGKKVMLVAADTFRAAAVDQLRVWADRSGASFHAGRDRQDPASVAYDGVRRSMEEGFDVVIIDTAGRLHTRKNLVEELKKIVKVCGKALEGAPHEVLLVLDATTGQNAIQQANIFRGEVGVNGIVLTKLDGTAKGGVVIGICDLLGIPVRYVGVGERVEDLQPFSPEAFVEGLFGPLDSQS